jgi:predicted nucleic acid-binding protein
VDTGPLYALSDPDDSRHERAREELGRLKARRLRLVVPFPTLIESHALVQRKLGLAQARSFLRQVVRTAILLTPTEEDYRGAIRRVSRYPDQDISLVDALGAEIGDRLEAPAWTYDHHFDVMDARVWRR